MYADHGDKSALECAHSDVDKGMLVSESDVTEGWFRLLYSAPEALQLRDQWKRLLLSPPLSNKVVAIAVDD